MRSCQLSNKAGDYSGDEGEVLARLGGSLGLGPLEYLYL